MGEVLTPLKSGNRANKLTALFIKSVSKPGKVKPKLRYLYEVTPISFLCEMAGGDSSDGKISIMDVKCTGYDHIHDILIGSSEEVQRCVRFLQVFEDK